MSHEEPPIFAAEHQEAQRPHTDRFKWIRSSVSR
jgi:hypothetical protein